MTRSTRLRQPGWLSGAFHFFIIYVAFEADTAEVWPFALMAMAAVSFVAWVGNYRRYRQIHDLPTSRIASAAQGYVELVGRAQNLAATPVLSRLAREPCCWYQYSISRKDSDNKWQHVESGASEDEFLIVDDTGECVISPQGAEVLTQDHKSWSEGSYRYEESLLLPSSLLYAIGEFSTAAGPAATQSGRAEQAAVGTLIAEWKRDRKRLHERFDANRDGTIDVKEWERARAEALNEVRKRRGENRAIEGVHTLSKPRDGRLFLLANELPDALGARYRFWSWAHVALFIGCGSLGFVLL